ncbi:MAG: F0F1 ATP synthase subunit delta [Candidatus Omnitrophota bacterium]|nr:F0F1 ATP synthase subunit delta [Candidatus Omnitrophota bacterium]
MFLLQLAILQAVMFGAVIYFLKKTMYGDTQSAVKRLNESYQDMTKKKEELAAKVKQMEEELLKKKDEAEKIAIQIRDDAEKESKEKGDAITKKAREEAERIISDTIMMKDKIREDIKKEEDLKMLDYCSAILCDTLKDSVRDEVDQALVKDFLEGLKGMDMNHVPPGINEIEVVTRSNLSDALRSTIIEAVKRNTKKSVTVKETADGTIIGGVIIKFGSLVLDGSLAGKLKDVTAARKQKIDEKM